MRIAAETAFWASYLSARAFRCSPSTRPSIKSHQISTHLGENVVSENEYRSAMAVGD